MLDNQYIMKHFIGTQSQELTLIYGYFDNSFACPSCVARIVLFRIYLDFHQYVIKSKLLLQTEELRD